MGRGKNPSQTFKLDSAEILFKHRLGGERNKLTGLAGLKEYPLSGFAVASLEEKQKMQSEIKESLREFLFKGFRTEDIQTNTEIRQICSVLRLSTDSLLVFFKNKDNPIFSPETFEKFNLLNNILLKIKNLDTFNEGSEYLVAASNWCDSEYLSLKGKAIDASIIELYTQYGIVSPEVWKRTDEWLKDLARVPGFFGAIHRPAPEFPVSESELIEIKNSKKLFDAIEDVEEILPSYGKSNFFIDILNLKIKKQIDAKRNKK